jgi:hypothetical protein
MKSPGKSSRVEDRGLSPPEVGYRQDEAYQRRFAAGSFMIVKFLDGKFGAVDIKLLL